ncbi:MAG: hypothetical protein PHF86_02970 [Candidatus Nanoarchaeia archaeon]|jgi:thymidylate kinase|nr:hypothetical protein [Candidatus Nanoarchaeia archaeon]
MIILFCGPDTSGKDSLMHELAKLYDYQYYMSPRSPICNIVYDIINKRNNIERYYRNMDLIGEFIKLGAFFVYVKVEPDVLVKRAISRNEQHINKLEDFKKHIEVYEDIIGECKEHFDHKKIVTIENCKDIVDVANELKTKIDCII